MGEYANYRGSQVKIGTCESMYYLRADQRELVDYGFTPDVLEVVRFRFPFPDEDGIEPGAFEDYDHGVRIPGWTMPAEIAAECDHGAVQFVSQAGYNLCIPCPEGPDSIEGLTVHRNGWRGGPRVTMQGFRNGELRTIIACGSCGHCWNMPLEVAESIADAFRAEAVREEWRRKYDPVTDTYLDDYGFEPVHHKSYRAELEQIAARIIAGYYTRVPVTS